jgi:S1-C subfamily serine protease
MLAAMRTSSAIAALSLMVGLAPVAGAQPAAPPAPAAPAPAAPPAPAAAPSATPAGVTPAVPPTPAAAPVAATPAAPRATGGLTHADEVRQGVVRLERGGRLLGMGAVLRSDGRILSALSALGHGNFIEARFADGSVLGVRIVHSDRPWDLALLAPQGGHWTAGLRPSVLDVPSPGMRLHRFRARAGRLEAATVTVSTQEDLLGRDGATLSDALVLSSRFNDDELGAPLFDEQGEVAAIIVQACAPANEGSCQLSTFGAPVSALKQFLRKAPAREPLPAAWLGFRGVAAHDGSVAGVRVVAVEANGPAEQAGLRGGGARPGSSGAASGSNADLIVAVQDAPVTTPEELRDAVNRFALAPAAPAKPDAPSAAGDRHVRLLVFGSGKFREVSLPLRAPRQLPGAAPNLEKPAPRSTITTPSPPADKPPSPPPPQ